MSSLPLLPPLDELFIKHISAETPRHCSEERENESRTERARNTAEGVWETQGGKVIKRERGKHSQSCYCCKEAERNWHIISLTLNYNHIYSRINKSYSTMNSDSSQQTTSRKPFKFEAKHCTTWGQTNPLVFKVILLSMRE